MDVTAVREGIAKTLAPLTALQDRIYAQVPDTPHVPCVIVYPENIRYQQVYDGDPDATFILHVLTSAATIRGQSDLDLFVGSGPGSIPAAIDAGSTLAGNASSAQVTDLRNYGTLQLTDGGTKYYSAQLILDVYAF